MVELERKNTKTVQDLLKCAQELSEEQVAEFKECFALFDADGSGTVDTSELGTVMKSLGQKMSDEDLAFIIQEVDADSSGTVDFAEFLGMMGRQMKDHDSDMVLRTTFNLFDVSDGGRVAKSNLKYVLAHLCDKMSADEIERLVDEAADGAEDLDFVQFMRLFRIE
uniref:EF-hand domain-containing protein n=1 Tax=Mantoniella antarctica TaxID=81844 RepID=A0A7S0X7Z3_9CHLO|mmetsp:Transcript_8299/g.13050  ORF Transcript_8299/g.13050 Transcript_8299/m.13050 type:complete len:166 (+) Transcript_8299:292-789(+)